MPTRRGAGYEPLAVSMPLTVPDSSLGVSWVSACCGLSLASERVMGPSGSSLFSSGARQLWSCRATGLTPSAPRVHSASPPGSHPPRQIWRCVSSRGLAIAACLPGLGSRGFALGRVFLGHLGLGQKTKPRDGWCCSALGAALDTGSFSETPRLRDGADCVCPITLYRARPASSSIDSIPFWDSSHLIRLMGRMSLLVSFKSSFV